jgi:hypothetical protein
MHAVIHNAGISSTKDRSPTPEGHASILAVNTLAPYMLTALIERPRRLVYLSSSMHGGGTSSLRDIAWSERRWNASQGIFGQQAVSDGIRVCDRETLARGAQQRR